MPAQNSKNKKSPAQPRSHTIKAVREQELAGIKSRRQPVSIVLAAVGVLYFILVMFPGLHRGLHGVLGGLFGGLMTSMFWCAMVFYFVFLLASRPPEQEVSGSMLRALILNISACSFFYTVAVADSVKEMSFVPAMEEIFRSGSMGQGAGIVGGFLGYLLTALFGKPLAIVIILLTTAVTAMLLFRIGLVDVFQGGIVTPARKAAQLGRDIFIGRRYDDEDVDDFDDDEDVGDDPQIAPPVEETKRPAPAPPIHRPDAYPGEPQRKPRRKAILMISGDEYDTAGTGVTDDPRTPANKQSADPGVSQEWTIEDAAAQDPLDELTRRAAEKKTRKQKAAEIAAEADSFGKEVSGKLEGGGDIPEEYKFPPISMLSKPEFSDDSDIR
ncbi:MAG: hypothetical protein FWE86_02530, partial [Oscillospiraceae bacterium]|nr:hypothetical protein [Oscillospiraceae bacterium]